MRVCRTHKLLHLRENAGRQSHHVTLNFHEEEVEDILVLIE